MIKTRNQILKLLFILSSLILLINISTTVNASSYVYTEDLKDRFIDLNTKNKGVFMWTDKQGFNGKALVAPLRSDNTFYPKTPTSKMKINFLPVPNSDDLYQIQLPGNYFVVDDSKRNTDPTLEPMISNTFIPEHRYYVLGQKPKYTNTRATWRMIPTFNSKLQKMTYRIQNVSTGRYLSVAIKDPRVLGSPLKLVLRPEQNINYVHNFYITPW
ncbi:hypothetical protein [Enterococcus hirae]